MVSNRLESGTDPNWTRDFRSYWNSAAAAAASVLGDAALAVGRDALGEALEAHRAADGEALGDVAVHLDQQVEDVALLDPFGDDLASERMGKLNGRLDHQPVGAVVDHPFDEALVDLDLARRDLLQIVEGRQAGAIVID